MKYRYLLLSVFCTTTIMAQERYKIEGRLLNFSGKEIVLKKYNGISDQILETTKTDSAGYFQLHYPKEYSGAASLQIDSESPVVVLLNNENFRIEIEKNAGKAAVAFGGSAENDAFFQAIEINQLAENKLAGLNFLLPLYKNEQEKWIRKEILEAEKQLPLFLELLPKDSYTRFYSSVLQQIQKNRSVTKSDQSLTLQIEAFLKTDFAAKRLLNSGLLVPLIESHFYIVNQIEGENKDKAFKNSIDIVLQKLDDNSLVKQDIAQFLFNFFEQQNLKSQASYLALKMLSDNKCNLDSKSEFLFEQYRKMGIGQVAPDIYFDHLLKYRKLSDINTHYKLVVFGSSWCPHCIQEIPELKKSYKNWKEHYNLEIIFISIDTDVKAYTEFVNDFPWVNFCDFKGWESKAAKDYYVSSTPMMYLLDSQGKILAKPLYKTQIDAWLLQQKN